MVLAPRIVVGLCSDVLCGQFVHVRARMHTHVYACLHTAMEAQLRNFHSAPLIALLSHAFGIHYP